MWIVMTSSAKTPSSWKWKAPHRNIAMVNLSQEYTAKGLTPAMISDRAKGISKLSTMRSAVIHLGMHRVGNTEKGAYQKALADANERCQRLNNMAPIAQAAEIMTWGGSA